MFERWNIPNEEREWLVSELKKQKADVAKLVEAVEMRDRTILKLQDRVDELKAELDDRRAEYLELVELVPTKHVPEYVKARLLADKFEGTCISPKSVVEIVSYAQELGLLKG